MTTMECDEVRDLLASFADGELTDDERKAVAVHLELCHGCSDELAALIALRDRIRRAGTFALPKDIATRLEETVGALVHGPTRSRRRYTALAASHAAAAVLGSFLAFAYLSQQQTEERALDEVVTAYVRSTLADQPVQIASSESHTVRPWFMGKLTYSPPVRDLTAEGFPLIGGRLDYLFDQTTAALVFGRRKHRISLFVFPAEADTAPVAVQGSRHGYNVVSWRDGPFAYIAASDLNQAELEEFAKLIRTPAT